MNSLEELEDAYSFLRDPIIKSAIDMIKERDARIKQLEADKAAWRGVHEGAVLAMQSHIAELKKKLREEARE